MHSALTRYWRPLLSLFFVLHLFHCLVLGEEMEAEGMLKGVVLNRTTREPIPSANIVLEGENRGAAADLEGHFEIPHLSPGTYHVRASAIGYEPHEISELLVLPGRDRMVEFLLQPSAVVGEEVTVTASKVKSVSSDLPTSARSLRYEEVRRAPGATEDVQRMIQSLPGVAGESDQNNEIVVRGGSPFENLIVLDGIEVENLNHFGYPAGTGGPISALNPEFLQEVTFASGGFSARYGDKLSSVLDLDLREGSRDAFGGSADFNMAGVGGSLEGPWPGKRGSYLVSYHKSYLDLVNEAVGLTAIPHYWNAQGKFTYDLSNRHLLSMNALYADDSINIEDESGYSRGAQKVDNQNSKLLLGGRLRSMWGAGYSDLVIARTRNTFMVDVFKVDSTDAGQRVEWPWVYQEYNETTWQASLSYTGKARGGDEWSVGGGIKPIRFEREQQVGPDTTVFNDGYLPFLGLPDGNPDTLVHTPQEIHRSTTATKTSGFAQYAWRPSNLLTVVGGIRYDGFEFSGQHTFAPRFSLQYLIHSDWRAGLAVGRYYQAQPTIVYSDDANGANETLAHSHADQIVASLAWFPVPSTHFTAEAYFKQYGDLLISEEAVVRETTGDYSYNSERYLTDREKQAWGVELFAHRRLSGAWYGTLRYSYGHAKAKDPAYGEFDAPYDFRQVLTGVIGYRTNLSRRPGYKELLEKPVIGGMLKVLPINGDELIFSTRYRYISGRPYTNRVWYDEGEVSPRPIYEGHWENVGINNRRYPAYSRWDLRVDNKHYFGGSALTFYMEAQNVLDGGNVSEYAYADGGEIDTVYQFRFFFVGGVKYEF